MNAKKLERLCFRWSLLSLFAGALVIGVIQLISGGIEPSNSLSITRAWTINLPFNFSVWWNLALGPIITTSVIWAWFSENDVTKDIQTKLLMPIGLFAGTVFSLILNLVLQHGIAPIIGVIILVSLLSVLILKKENLLFVIVFCFFAGMGNCLINEILAGLISTSIIVVVGFILAIFVRSVFTFIENLPVSQVGFKNWIFANDIKSDKEEVQ